MTAMGSSRPSARAATTFGFEEEALRGADGEPVVAVLVDIKGKSATIIGFPQDDSS